MPDRQRFENSLVVPWLRNADEWFGFCRNGAGDAGPV
jgi:hypothetical protein